MKVSADDLRGLLHSTDPEPQLVVYEGRTTVVAAGDLRSGHYPGALPVISREDLVTETGQRLLSENDLRDVAAKLDVLIISRGG